MPMNTNTFIIFLLISLLALAPLSCNAQSESSTFIAVCEMNKGCVFASIDGHESEISSLLQQHNFSNGMDPNKIVVLEKCQTKVMDFFSRAFIDSLYGGKGKDTQIVMYDFKKHLIEHHCIQCPNVTKKINFSFIDKIENVSGSTFQYINIQANESYMPNAACQMMTPEAESATVDVLIRNNNIEQYIIVEGKKMKSILPYSGIYPGNDKRAHDEFKKEFKPTGRTRASTFNTHQEIEYKGKASDNKVYTVWLLPVDDVCIESNRFSCVGMYTLGYIRIEHQTYLTTEWEGADFNLKVTQVSNGNYSFSPVGY